MDVDAAPFFRRLAGYLTPPLCVVCGHACGARPDLCGDCVRELNLAPVIRRDPPDGLAAVVSCAPHEGVARKLLTTYKFRGMTGLGRLIAGYMADLAAPGSPGLLVVPVPPGRWRRRLRGFDPVEPLAGEVAASVPGAVLRTDLLVRRGGGRQRGRSRAGRLAAPPDIVPGPQPFPPGQPPVLLVDDVITTGATLIAAATCLRRAGAGPVRAVSFTRRL